MFEACSALFVVLGAFFALAGSHLSTSWASVGESTCCQIGFLDDGAHGCPDIRFSRHRLTSQLLVFWQGWQHSGSSFVSLSWLWAPRGAHYGFDSFLAPSVFEGFAFYRITLDDPIGCSDMVFFAFPPYPQPYSRFPAAIEAACVNVGHSVVHFFTDFDDDIFAGFTEYLEVSGLAVAVQLVLADELPRVFDYPSHYAVTYGYAAPHPFSEGQAATCGLDLLPI